MDGRIIRQDGGRYVVFDDLPRVKIVSELDDETLAQIGGKLIKKAKKKAIKRLKKQKTKPKKSKRKAKKAPSSKATKSRKRVGKPRGTFVKDSKPTLTAGGVNIGADGTIVASNMNGLMSTNQNAGLLAQQALNRMSQPLFDPRRTIEYNTSTNQPSSNTAPLPASSSSSSQPPPSSSSSAPSSSSSAPSSSSSPPVGPTFQYTDEELRDRALWESRLNTLKQEVRQAERDKSDLSDEILDFNNRLTALNSQLTNLENDRDNLNDQLIALEQEEERLKKTLIFRKGYSEINRGLIRKKLKDVRIERIRIFGQMEKAKEEYKE